ncbi:MAG TPA: DNA polymerase III subunit gamma/tau [Caulobacteraceae bacterium]|jgi:DNA polymerase-3 subunit gamma/tau|nr:DNA polymerase III subunit gamma/tau [Caulobacteraceae bacterium]
MSDADSTLDPDAPDPEERDANTDDMFGGAPPESAAASAPPLTDAAYQVLARKYRPRTFEDLIGQEAMVRTLANAFSSGRIAHAFMLTGVRGVGKTTTARLLARALNYETETADRPSIELTAEGRHCQAIIEGRHMDVLELDAASRTGVDDMRELLDSMRYAPVEARYKVYVIDEVHMLSKGAFNALLKTLEEPPPHAKFIFATTEIRKVPVTILSRCQRFDLRRVEPPVLIERLEKVCAAEGALIDAEGLALIARAAEGSVRDALSLLDQAMVQADRGQIVSAEVVRDMLGLADRSATIALFELTMGGRIAEALHAFRALYNFGADPAEVMTDLLEHAHAASVAKTLGADALMIPRDQAARLAAVGSEASAGSLSRAWQMLLKAFEECRRAPDPAAAAEMALIRLAYAADLPGPEEALKRLQEGQPPVGSASPAPSQPSGGGGGNAARALAPTYVSAQPHTNVRPVAPTTEAVALGSFGDVMALIELKRDVTLKLDVERYIRPIEVKPGQFRFALAEGAPANLPQRLSGRLKEWTGRPWMMDIQGGAEGVETAYERERREDVAARARIEADPFVQAVREAFPGAEVVGVRKTAAPAAEAPVETDDED